MLSLDVNRQMPCGGVLADFHRRGRLRHLEGDWGRRDILAHVCWRRQLQKRCLRPLVYLLRRIATAAAGLSSDAARPCTNGRIAPAVRVEDRERIGGARLTMNRDENASATDERLENATVVRLESDAAHRAGEPELRQIARAPLQRRDQWTTSDDLTD